MKPWVRESVTVGEEVAGRYYVALRAAGPHWDPTRRLREQEHWDDHAAFMDALAAEGWIVLGGPLGDGTRALHVVAAGSEREVEERFAADPWTEMGLLALVSVDPWQILLRAAE
jgi:uncharacterized protein YciI